MTLCTYKLIVYDRYGSSEFYFTSLDKILDEYFRFDPDIKREFYSLPTEELRRQYLEDVLNDIGIPCSEETICSFKIIKLRRPIECPKPEKYEYY